HGPDAAAGPIVVTDTLPAGLRFVSASGSAWRCDAAHAVATCRRAEALGAGRSSTFSVTVHVLKAAFPGATNRASVSSGTSDPDPTNDLVKDQTTIHLPDGDPDRPDHDSPPSQLAYTGFDFRGLLAGTTGLVLLGLALLTCGIWMIR